MAAGQAVAVLAGVIVWALGALASIGGFISDNWAWVAPILWGVTFALIAQGAAALWAKRQILLTALATMWKTICDWAATAAIIAMEFAQHGLNAALAMCPLTWIIGLIIIVIVVIYLAVAAVNHFAGTSISATGIIAGAFMVLGTYIYNAVAYMWNAFASFAEFLVNVFQHPVYSIKALMVNLATNFLDVCLSMTKGWDGFATGFANAVIDAVNLAINAWNKFMDILPDKVKSTLGLGKGGALAQRTSITSDLQAAKGGLKNWLGDAPADYWKAPKMEMKTLSGAWDTGYGWGSGLADKFSIDALKKKLGGSAGQIGKTNGTADMLKNAGLGNGAAGGAGSGGVGNGAAGKIGRDTGKTAGNTAKMADSLSGTEEEIKYLRDLAEREVINRFTTAEIKVDVQNNNTINRELDIDGVMSRFTEKLHESMVVAAEGVHS